MATVDKVLPLSKKMAKLQVLHISRPLNITDSQLENTVLFIKQNREAFPGKQLTIHFTNGWVIPNVFKGASRDKDVRDRLFQFMKPSIAIYEAAREPKTIYATSIPYFYQNADEIYLDRLRQLVDLDENRHDQDEGPSMDSFLKRCTGVRELEIRVGSPNMLSWAADEALKSSGSQLILPRNPGHETASSESVLDMFESIRVTNDEDGHLSQQSQLDVAQLSTKTLQRVETVKLMSSHPYRFGLQTFNDALVAFSSSLRDISLEVIPDREDILLPTPDNVMKSLELRTVPWANQTGSWPLLLPHLRSINIKLSQVASIQIGSFAQSPSLEELCIQFGNIRSRDLLQNGDHLPEVSSDVRWQQAKIDKTLFPMWSLPRLRILKLLDSAATRFDFASLSSMKSLERLEILVSDYDLLIGYQDYKDIQSRIWKERLLEPEKEYGRYKPLDTVKPWMWPLPQLKRLDLTGPVVTMFSLDWLLVCPRLEKLELSCLGDQSEINCIPFFAKCIEKQENSSSSGNSNGDNKPYLDSRLESIELRDLEISSENVTRLLTIYAPLLHTLHLEHVNSNDGWPIMEGIRNADRINSAYRSLEYKRRSEGQGNGKENEINESRLPGLKLTSVIGSHYFNKTERRKLRLELINDDQEYKYREAGVRVYMTLSQSFVDENDKYALNTSEDDEEDEYY
ncbi:hypothetical protein BGZ49_005961 [Haplosporangium sp. Z 27]|nr:hypothetical protein BGZ49_005961 [Haplosporangium sp. Z 27]